VMTQVDLGLTSVGQFDSADSSLALMALIKNLGRHIRSLTGVRPGLAGRSAHVY
jgi:hypothetical protein